MAFLTVLLGKYSWHNTSAVKVKNPLVIAFVSTGRLSKTCKYQPQGPLLEGVTSLANPRPASLIGAFAALMKRPLNILFENIFA